MPAAGFQTKLHRQGIRLRRRWIAERNADNPIPIRVARLGDRAIARDIARRENSDIVPVLTSRLIKRTLLGYFPRLSMRSNHLVIWT